MILPVLAILLGMTGALATSAAPTVTDLIDVSDQIDCEPVGTCDRDFSEEMCSTKEHPTLNQVPSNCSIVQDKGRFAPLQ